MAVLKLVANQAGRSLASMFPGFFASGIKHDHYKDFGYPEQVTFDQLFRVYHRNGIARAGVDKTVGKTWESNPWLLERARDDGEGHGPPRGVREEALQSGRSHPPP